MLKIILLMIFFLSSFYSQAQQNNFAGAGLIHSSPLGTFSDRMNNSFGGLIFWGEKINDNFQWRLKGEYFKTSQPNEEKLIVRAEAEFNNQKQQLTFPLKNIEMSFTLAGLAAEGDYRFFDAGFVNTEIVFGFGFYYWEHLRGGFSDSLFVDTTGAGNLMLVKNLEVPSLLQKDWSGGLTLGLNFNFFIADPVVLEIGANYKLIIAELWPALSLDIENVSGIQIVDLRAGVKYKF